MRKKITTLFLAIVCFTILLFPASYWWGVGAQPADEDELTAAWTTYIQHETAISITGKVTKIQLFCATGANFDFAVFSKSGNDFTDEHRTTFAVTAGYHEYVDPTHFNKADLPTSPGEYLGFYGVAGVLDRKSSGGPGYWLWSGDGIVDGTPHTYTETTNGRDIQLRFWIEEDTGDSYIPKVIIIKEIAALCFGL